MRNSTQTILHVAAGLTLVGAGAWIIGKGMAGPAGSWPSTLLSCPDTSQSIAAMLIGLALLATGARQMEKKLGHCAGPAAAALLLCFALAGQPGLDMVLRNQSTPWISHAFLTLAAESILWQAMLMSFMLYKLTPADQQQDRPQKGQTAFALTMGGLVFLISAWIMLRSPDTSQSLWGALIVGMLTAIAMRAACPGISLTVMALVPTLLIPACFFYVALTSDTNLLAQWYAGALPGFVNALPAQAAAGSLLGLSLGAIMVQQAPETQPQPSAS